MDLLEWLFCQIHVMYLSDLRVPRYWPRVIYWLNRGEAEQYSIKEWEEAVAYIFCPDYPVKYENITEAKEDCRKRLERYRQEKEGRKKKRKEVSGWTAWGLKEQK